MKTKVLVLFALVLSANLRAQVTIGALTAPAAGALLDLNRGTPGGLLLSNVQIENLSKIPHSAPGLFPGIDGTNDDTNTALTGAVVYHIGENNIPAGLYVWNGTNWTPITENCLPADLLSVTLTSSTVLAKTGDPVTFSVASSASERCAGSETYYWYQATATDDYGAVSATTVYPESSKSIVFSSAGTYKVQVEVSNIYSASAKATSNEVTVYVTNDGKVTPEMLNHSYGIVGETCLDVMKPNAGQAPTVYAARKPGFPGGNYEKTYKFVHQSEYFDLSLSCDDSANIVEAITVYPPKLAFADGTAVDGYYEKEFKIKFKSNIRDLVPANGNSLTVKLTASYRDSNNEPKLAYLEIRVEDGTCVCPAKTESNKWKNFMCHNLGGLDIISSSQLITRAHHGDWYRFGADTVSMANTLDHDINNNTWDDSYVQNSGNWTNDATPPCPAGWRLPTNQELSNLLNSYNSWPTASGWIADKFNAVRQVSDYLYLPAAGLRNEGTGKLANRGYGGYYWSSSASGSNAYAMSFTEGGKGVNPSSRPNGFSVRCVSKE